MIMMGKSFQKQRRKTAYCTLVCAFVFTKEIIKKKKRFSYDGAHIKLISCSMHLKQEIYLDHENLNYDL